MKSPLWLLLLAASATAEITLPDNPPPARPAAEPGAALAAYEIPAVLSAARLLGQDAAGPAHRVREQVPTDGYMAHFTIDSDYGEFQCVGTAQAQARIKELEAIRKLVAVSKSDLFAEAVKRSIEQPIDAVKNIAKDPVASAKAVPKSVGHFFKKVGKSVGNAAANVRDRSEGGEAAGTGADLSRTAKGVIGFDNAKLECSKQLGVDPYTDNERLQQEIEKVSWVFFSGGLPLRVGAAVASGGASVALTAAKVVGLPDEIYALTPAELTMRNQQAMEAMGVPEKVSRKFSSNAALSITLRRSIIRSLQALGGVKGRASVIGVAAECESRRQMEFLDQALALLARRQPAGQAAWAALEIIGRLPGAVDVAGVLSIPAPVDYLSWTLEVAEFAHRDDLLGRRPVLLLAGGASERTRSELTALGWTVGTP
ncbi:MAG: hypothetical protein NTW21_34755 [Verrucomicrobia bacterium]|nr:hypothetical protein [Verrucomicrobiota bacterium]